MKRLLYLGNNDDAETVLFDAIYIMPDLTIITLDSVVSMGKDAKFGKLVANFETTAVDFEMLDGEEKAISYLARPGFCELVVIPNNLGIGVKRARFVDLGLRATAAIIWNKYHLGDERPYAKLGYANFFSRSSLGKYVVDYFS